MGEFYFIFNVGFNDQTSSVEGSNFHSFLLSTFENHYPTMFVQIILISGHFPRLKKIWITNNYQQNVKKKQQWLTE